VPYYSAADFYVLPTFYDPCSLGVLEAAASGLASVTTRFNGAAEAFGDGGCIVVDSPLDRGEIVAGYEALADPITRRKHSRACGGLADYLGVERHVEELLAAYGRAPTLR